MRSSPANAPATKQRALFSFFVTKERKKGEERKRKRREREKRGKLKKGIENKIKKGKKVRNEKKKIRAPSVTHL